MEIDSEKVPEDGGGIWVPERRTWRQRDAPRGSASFSQQHPIARVETGCPGEGQQTGSPPSASPNMGHPASPKSSRRQNAFDRAMVEDGLVPPGALGCASSSSPV